MKKLYEPSATHTEIKVEDCIKTMPKNRTELRQQNPTFAGFMASTIIDPKKEGIDNKPAIIAGIQQKPGGLGWGIERSNLKADSKIITDDMRVPSYPIYKGHLDELDKNKQNVFTRYSGDRAAKIDQMLGIDYDLYHALNMQAQRAALKSLDMQKKFTASIPKDQKLSRKEAIQASPKCVTSYGPEV